MNLVPWKRNRGDVINREHPVDLFRRQMDTLFDRFFGGLSEDFGQNRFWDFGITEGDKEFVVRAEMPSFEEKELDVRLENDMLTINAQKEHKGDGTQEFRSFSRTVSLPAGVEADKVQATYRNGVLELHIPRPEGSMAKRIPVQVKADSGQKALSPTTGNGNKSSGAKKEETAKAGQK
jgi:HSP20 family protein